MPIMNMLVSGGGTPATFKGLELDVDNGVLRKTPGQYIYDFTGVTQISDLRYLYRGADLILPSGHIDLGSVTTIVNAGFEGAFSDLQNEISAVDLGSLTSIGTSGLASAFSGIGTNSSFSVDMHSLVLLTNDSEMDKTFSGSTISSIDLSALQSSASYSMNQTFAYCPNLLGLSFPEFSSAIGDYSIAFLCRSSGVVHVSMPKLRVINGDRAAQQAFYACSDLQTLELPLLYQLTGVGAGLALCYGDSALLSVNLSNLAVLNSNAAMQQAFGSCSALTDLRFPSITTTSFGSYTNQFTNMCVGIPNITLHFPSNVQSIIEGLAGYSTTAPFGADAGTVLFDLPATVTLTGNDGHSYKRNPGFDTASALAWYDTWNAAMYLPDDPVYYTSGTTDPAVNDTIYSDDACTVSVTTISSIA